MSKSAEPWLESKLSELAHEKFERLCKRCDRDKLAFLLGMLVFPDWNVRDRWSNVTNGLEPDDLRRIARQAEELSDEITRLRETPQFRDCWRVATSCTGAATLMNASEPF